MYRQKRGWGGMARMLPTTHRTGVGQRASQAGHTTGEDITHWSMKDEFRPFQQMQIPDSHDPIRVIQRGGILVVRCRNEFGVLLGLALFPWQGSSVTHLCRPVKICHGSSCCPPVVRKGTRQLDSLRLAIIAGRSASRHQMQMPTAGTHKAPSRPMV